MNEYDKSLAWGCLVGLLTLAMLLGLAARISTPTLTPEEREAIRRAVDSWRANDAAEKWKAPLRGLLERTK